MAGPVRYYDKTTTVASPWSRGTITGSSSQLSPDAGARLLFSDPLDEDSYETKFDRRQSEFMNIKETVPTDKSIGGVDA